MQRRTFLKSLLVAPFAAKAVVEAVSEEPKPTLRIGGNLVRCKHGHFFRSKTGDEYLKTLRLQNHDRDGSRILTDEEAIKLLRVAECPECNRALMEVRDFFANNQPPQRII